MAVKSNKNASSRRLVPAVRSIPISSTSSTIGIIPQALLSIATPSIVTMPSSPSSVASTTSTASLVSPNPPSISDPCRQYRDDFSNNLYDDESAAHAILHFYRRASLNVEKKNQVEEETAIAAAALLHPGHSSPSSSNEDKTNVSVITECSSISRREAEQNSSYLNRNHGPNSSTAPSACKPRIKTDKSSAKNKGGTLVNHTYTDLSTLPPSFVSTYRPRRGGAAVPFPLRLHMVLSGETDYSRVIKWRSHGRAFAVIETSEFVRTCLGRFFRQSKMTSFQRQLNLYGYRRITRGPDAGSYYHQMFLRGRPELVTAMRRVKVKGNGVKAAANPEEEPNFYHMPYVGVARGFEPGEEETQDDTMKNSNGAQNGQGAFHNRTEGTSANYPKGYDLTTITKVVGPKAGKIASVSAPSLLVLQSILPLSLHSASTSQPIPKPSL